MKQAILFYLMCILTFSSLAQDKEFLQNIIIVKFKSEENKTSFTQKNISKLLQKDLKEITPLFVNFNLKKKQLPKQYDLSTLYKIELKNNSNFYIHLNELNQSNNIEYAEPYPISYLLDVPNDPKIESQYYLDKMNAFNAHNITHGDTSIVIGIVDSGVDLLHEDLKDNFKYNYNDPINNIDDDKDGYIDNYYGWDVADDDFNPQSLVNIYGDANYHGTKVSGAASASTNNETGIASIGYNCKIMPIKVMNNSGTISAGYEGIIYAADHGCQIINCSWGNNFPTQFGQDVINYAALYKNCLVVAAAGNKVTAWDKRADTWFYPASYDNVLSVAGTDANDLRWDGSSYATTVDVSTGGLNVFSTKQNNSYGSGSGTSYAAPQVAGLAALLKSIKPGFTQKQLAEQIRITCDNIDTIPDNVYYKNQMGYGRINAYNALTIDSLPSVRIEDLKTIGSHNNRFIIGDTINIWFTAKNYLAQLQNSTIRLTSNSEFIEPINNFFSTGALGTFESINNSNSPLTLKIIEGISQNENIWLKFEIKADGYNDYHIYELKVNLNYIDISENKITTTLTSSGKLGYVNRNDYMGNGFQYKNTNLMNSGGIIVALNSEQMASSLFDVDEFVSFTIIDTTRNNKNELEAFTQYSSLDETGLSVNISHTTLAKTIDLQNTAIIHKYEIENKLSNSLENVKFSQFIDWDLYSYTNNKIEFNDELNLLYTYNLGNNVVCAAICLLNDMECIPYGFDITNGGNGGIDITSDFNNNMKWYAMNNSRNNAGNDGDSINVAGMLTTDFFNISANNSFEIAFANIIGDNYNDLIIKATAIKSNYLSNKQTFNSEFEMSVFPNPVKDQLKINLINKTENVSIKIYDQKGNMKLNKTFSSKQNILINTANFNPGLFLIQYISNSKTATLKFIKVN